ncbi:CynX/NimT family MFS transporter [Actinopolymorpha singaporensis]|uniref:CynX/NimT family MFS transporter n=1 Tax=Actinopolymorpha singaporensis TaxID=117157 RepID=UPI0015612B95|nr:MFS transporter [Actinopolymorpha singaporensis]
MSSTCESAGSSASSRSLVAPAGSAAESHRSPTYSDVAVATLDAERATAQPTVAAQSAPARGGWPAWLLLAAVVLLAFNLRPAVSGLGAVLDEVSADLGVSALVAGVLTTLPVLSFAAFGAMAPGWSRRFGARRVLAAALLAVVAGQLVRVLVPSVPVFLLATTVALAGMAAGNVLVPAFVKAYFPGRVGLATAAYTTSMAVGTTLPAALTVPIAQAFGGWRFGLGAWAVAAGVALLPWLVLARRRGVVARPAGSSNRHESLWSVGRSPLAWSLAGYFGLQSLQAYAAFGWLPQIFRDAGVDAAHAGLLLAILPLVGVPLSLLFPSLAARLPDQRPLVWACGGAYVVGYVGLLLAPASGAVAWAILLGLGGGAFPLTLTMIGLRSRSHDLTARLSGFTQSVGYLLAACGPLAMGALFDVTGGWTVPIGLLLVLVVPQVATGLMAARPRYVDDELAAADAAQHLSAEPNPTDDRAGERADVDGSGHSRG